MKTFFFSVFAFLFFSTPSFAADLTGNWAVRNPQPDGTSRDSFLDLKQDGDHVTGTVRFTQFYFKIVESTVTPDGFTLTAATIEPGNDYRIKIEGKLVGEDLQLTVHRRPNAAPQQMVAHHAPVGEGTLPAYIAPPALHNVPSNGLAKTPPMGWNSWNKFAGKVDDAAVRGMADAIVSTGMKDAGYIYVNIDDTWELNRDARGNILTNKKFPDMKALADYVHSKGLKIGIYSSPGPNTCAGYEGSYGHEEQDAKTYASWGIDYLKYDWCGAHNIYTNDEMQAVYQKMGDALLNSGRTILYSLCQYGEHDVWKWGPLVGGNSWRTTGDISDKWDSMTRIGFAQESLAPYAAPGHWNDPDMLEVGNGGMTDDEYKTHMTLWSILAAPLLAGNDIRNMPPNVASILMNRDVIAIDQDPDGHQGHRVSKSADQEIWIKSLSGGAQAVAIFNRASSAAKVSVKWSDLGLKSAPTRAKDLWSHSDLKLAPDSADYTAEVSSHGVILLRVTP
jgi:alpha-galactosidase